MTSQEARSIREGSRAVNVEAGGVLPDHLSSPKKEARDADIAARASTATARLGMSTCPTRILVPTRSFLLTHDLLILLVIRDRLAIFKRHFGISSVAVLSKHFYSHEEDRECLGDITNLRRMSRIIEVTGNSLK